MSKTFKFDFSQHLKGSYYDVIDVFLLNFCISIYVNSYSALKILSIDVSYVDLLALYIFPEILGVPGTKGAKSRVAQGVGVENFFGGSTYCIEILCKV